MKADEIMHVLRLTAMGRINHPDQQRLCEELERLLARGCKCAEAVHYTDEGPIKVVVTADPASVQPSTTMPTVVVEAPKRGRPKKAE